MAFLHNYTDFINFLLFITKINLLSIILVCGSSISLDIKVTLKCVPIGYLALVVNTTW